MVIKHEVQDGEGLSSIAEQYGFAPSTIWNDEANAALREFRDDPNILKPGDVLVVREKEPKWVAVATGAVHRFRRHGVPAIFRMQLFANRQPRAHLPFSLDVDGVTKSGQTDEQGVLAVVVPANARVGLLRIGNGSPIEVRFGKLWPLSEIRGVQQRLRHLAFLHAEAPGEWDEATRRALAAFQDLAGLPVTGEADKTTVRRLGELHDQRAMFDSVAK